LKYQGLTAIVNGDFAGFRVE